jgi:hypothetical protein
VVVVVVVVVAVVEEEEEEEEEEEVVLVMMMRAVFQGKSQFSQNSHTFLVPQGPLSVSQRICHHSCITPVPKFIQDLVKCSAVAGLQRGIISITSTVPV